MEPWELENETPEKWAKVRNAKKSGFSTRGHRRHGSRETIGAIILSRCRRTRRAGGNRKDRRGPEGESQRDKEKTETAGQFSANDADGGGQSRNAARGVRAARDNCESSDRGRRCSKESAPRTRTVFFFDVRRKAAGTFWRPQQLASTATNSSRSGEVEREPLESPRLAEDQARTRRRRRRQPSPLS